MSRQVGRPREFDENEVLTEIMSLFWKQGYEGTGLSDIMAATGLQKGSLYKAYGSKRHMYVCSLEHYEREVVDAGVTNITSVEIPARDRIYGFLSAPIQAVFGDHDRSGCFLCNASADDAAMDAETRDLIARGYRKLEKALCVPIAELHPEWPESKCLSIAQLVLTVYSGLRVMSRSEKSRERLEGVRDEIMVLIDR